ncbi:pyridine nucleotide transhydrogenase [Photobacterium sp. SDRW27]|uniref:pyridine nucleotide transhydrogenase n=1 Tax=Photobacterium obscurum TaxID=2829490 RepID=UPI00224405A6|nr:pyridine nucleotide transhydrogenase [Photobacterium obscurum]
MLKNSALIGFTGFVGSTLLKQTSFEHLYRSTNIDEIRNNIFDTVVCAGAPAQKWLANKDPKNDKAILDNLIDQLSTIKCKKFILISTVDVFSTPNEVDENSPIIENGLHAYGLHRRQLEKFVIKNFDDYLIIRLPGLVGPGLKKNVIFDFLNNNNIDAIESRGIFQFYPMVNLWSDIQIAIKANLKIVHLTSEPIVVSDIAEEGFGLSFKNEIHKTTAKYNMKTCYSKLYSGIKGYQYSKKETLIAIRAYAQSEAKKVVG